MFRFRRSRLLSIFLAVSLAFSSLVTVAHMPNATAAPHDQHAAAGTAHVPHAQHVSALDGPGKAACVSHDTCGGKCCVACTHCMTNMAVVSFQLSPHQPIQSSIVPVLRLTSQPSVQDRPPQA